MDLRERFDDFQEAINAAIEGKMASMWTALPASIVSVDFAAQTATLQPSVKSVVRKPDGSQSVVSMPMLRDVPLHFPGGGGVSLTFPVKAGDEALVVFSSRPIDSWTQSGGEQGQIDARTHDLSDGMALVGFRSKPKALSNVSSNSTQIRSDDGMTSIDLNPGSGVSLSTPHAVSINAASGVAIAAGGGGATIEGDLRVTGDVVAGTISLRHHIHSGIQPGGSNTAEPVP